MESFSGSNIKKFFTFSRRKAVLIFPLKNPPPPQKKKKKKKKTPPPHKKKKKKKKKIPYIFQKIKPSKNSGSRAFLDFRKQRP